MKGLCAQIPADVSSAGICRPFSICLRARRDRRLVVHVGSIDEPLAGLPVDCYDEPPIGVVISVVPAVIAPADHVGDGAVCRVDGTAFGPAGGSVPASCEGIWAPWLGVDIRIRGCLRLRRHRQEHCTGRSGNGGCRYDVPDPLEPRLLRAGWIHDALLLDGLPWRRLPFAGIQILARRPLTQVSSRKSGYLQLAESEFDWAS